MGANINKVILIGHCGGDPKFLSEVDGKQSSALISLATSEKWRDKETGEKKERTEWHSVLFFAKLAEIVNQHVKKGDLLYIEGGIRSRKRDLDDGTQKIYFNIIGRHVVFLSLKKFETSNSLKETVHDNIGHNFGVSNNENKTSIIQSNDNFQDDDIPF